MDIAISAALRKALKQVLVNIGGLVVTRADLETLDGSSWLNDKIIDAYLNLIAKRSQEDTSLPRTYAFSVFFLQVYAKRGYDHVSSWTRSIDLFSHDILLIPVHEKDHWCMTVVDFRLQQITYFDSMFNRNDRFLEKVLNYLCGGKMIGFLRSSSYRKLSDARLLRCGTCETAREHLRGAMYRRWRRHAESFIIGSSFQMVAPLSPQRITFRIVELFRLFGILTFDNLCDEMTDKNKS